MDLLNLRSAMKRNMYSENVWNSDYVHMTMATQQQASPRCCLLHYNPVSIPSSYLLIDKRLLMDLVNAYQRLLVVFKIKKPRVCYRSKNLKGVHILMIT